MSLKNKSMYAILGILNLSPCTGYDIKKYSDQVLSGFWNENFGHIYPTLKKMLQNGTIEVVPGEMHERKVRYQITKKGKKELHTWLIEETEQQPVRSEFMLKLLFSSNQPREQVTQMMKDYKEQHVNSLNRYLSMEQTLKDGIQEVTNERALFLDVVLRRGILSEESVLQWCDEVIEKLSDK